MKVFEVQKFPCSFLGSGDLGIPFNIDFFHVMLTGEISFSFTFLLLFLDHLSPSLWYDTVFFFFVIDLY